MTAARRTPSDGPSDFDLGKTIGKLEQAVTTLEEAVQGLSESQTALSEQVNNLPGSIWTELSPRVQQAVSGGIQAGVQQALQARAGRGAAFGRWARDNAGTIGTIVGIAVISAVSWVIAQWGGIGGRTPKGHP